MSRNSTPQPRVSPLTPSLGRRAVLRSVTTAGLLATVGIPPLARPAAAAIDGVSIDYKRCKVVFVSNASAIDTIAVYYADRDGDRNARYDIEPTTTNPRGYAPLVVEYDADEDRTQIQLAEPRGSLVCVVAEAGTERTVRTNPTDVCVPADFNSVPSASFTAETDDTPATTDAITVTVDEAVTFVSTATDPDEPERLSVAWDLDGDSTYETGGETATATYAEAGDVVVSLRATDDCGETDTASLTVTVEPEEEPPTGFGLTQVATLRADVSARASLGTSASLDGDTALVGAQFDSTLGQSAGAAYVFDRDAAGTWTETQRLLASDGEAADNFGTSASLDGDTAVVGSRAGGTGDEGAAYVFERDASGTWTETQKLVAGVPQPGAEFGVSVSLDGDTLAVGAYNEAVDGKTDAGAVYVFDRDTTGTWTQSQRIEGFTRAGDFFGTSVDLDGDRLAIGAPLDDRGARTDAGTAWIYARDASGTWVYEASPRASDGASDDRFGVVSLDGDTLVVGAFRDDLGSDTDAGSAYVFDRDASGAWTQSQKLVASNATADDNFGRAVSLDGDTAVVGSLVADSTAGTETGALYVYTREADGTWTERATATSDDAQTGDWVGSAVSLDGDRVLVGARLDDRDGQRDAGSAYVFEISR